MPETRSGTPFHDLDAFLRIPRIGGLALSPDGRRLVAAVQRLAADGKRFNGSLWELDPDGERPARRLTRSAKGESAPGFRPDGTLLFLSGRPAEGADATEATDASGADEAAEAAGPEGGKPGKDEAEETTALWALPPGGGEAERVAALPGGVDGYATARAADRIALGTSFLPGAADTAADAELRAARRKDGTSAILHEEPMVRFWDHDVGPAVPRLLTTGQLPAEQGALVDHGSMSRHTGEYALSADGALLAHVVDAGDHPDEARTAIVVSDAATGKRLRVLDEPGRDYYAPAFTPDGRGLVAGVHPHDRWEESGEPSLVLIEDAGDAASEPRDLLPESELWPSAPLVSPAPGPDGELVLFFAADELGHAPVFRLTVPRTGAPAQPVRLTADGAYSELAVTPDGRTLYALRSHIDAPPAPVRLDAWAADQQTAVIPAPGALGPADFPGRLAEVRTTAEDGMALRSWLVLPEEAGADAPAPLLLWVHGGPQHTWNAWTWRWNPWVAAANGYAVLLPDPALSTGYGRRMHERGWDNWGGNPYTDVIALTDAALERPDLDASRTGMMGGSFGGYMANWIATQTDRFRAIVTHASLWNLNGFAGTTDFPAAWRREIGDPLRQPERYEKSSPHLRAAQISTPMLVIHGDKDYRVPIGEGLALWADLVRFEVPAKFLYFPDEGHWILKPPNIRLWYRTWLNFMAHHVLGAEWVRPDHL
ncbi:prolyl oligopeptidase family serine peptidase [Phaeacidiphilus oryzae]|uniref:prolyl oligopeptidase family serine peptidase n=1 Tax=Phaeacidiphilus oryzae TaxID=348818 RepID=UPI000566A2EF|nr:prolyl oligopeptidase family serine peptidase [Phaeacidiphilus oryzae]